MHFSEITKHQFEKKNQKTPYINEIATLLFRKATVILCFK